MCTTCLTPADWLAGSVSNGDDAWLLVTSSRGTNQPDASKIRELAELPHCDVFIQSAGIDGATASILNQLAPPIALIAAPITEDDTLVISPRAATLSAESARRESVSQLILDLVCQGCRITWQESSTAPGDVRRLPALAPARPGRDQRWRLDSAPGILRDLLPGSQDSIGKTALRAGLLQVANWLDESHQASQSIEHEGRWHDGDYWHAIMHRREPDYGNSKYWFRSVGRHPVFGELAGYAVRLLDDNRAPNVAEWRTRILKGTDWEPFGFVDMCQAAARDDSSPLGIAARQIQWIEMLLLLRHCWNEVSG